MNSPVDTKEVMQQGINLVRDKGVSGVNPTKGNWDHPFEYDRYGKKKRLTLTGDTAKATLPEHADWQKKNPAATALYKYRSPWDFHQTPRYQAVSGISSFVNNPENFVARISRKGPGIASIAGGVGGVGVGWAMAVIHFSVVIFLAFLFILAFGFGLGVIALTRSLVAFVVVPILWLRSGILVVWLIGGLAPFIYAACWSGGFVGPVI